MAYRIAGLIPVLLLLGSVAYFIMSIWAHNLLALQEVIGEMDNMLLFEKIYEINQNVSSWLLQL